MENLNLTNIIDQSKIMNDNFDSIRKSLFSLHTSNIVNMFRDRLYSNNYDMNKIEKECTIYFNEYDTKIIIYDDIVDILVGIEHLYFNFNFETYTLEDIIFNFVIDKKSEIYKGKLRERKLKRVLNKEE